MRERFADKRNMKTQAIISGLLTIQDLPTLPQVVGRIIATTEDDHASAQDLTHILETDHAISARILRLANSPYYGLSQEVESIRRAVVVLGFDAVRNLALATSVVDVFSQKSQIALTPEDFWMHSFGTAKASQILAESHCRVESPDGCFTSALIHDIGKYLLAIVLENEYLEIAVAAHGRRCDLRDLEIKKMGVDHAEVGSWILNKWHFPLVFTEVVGNLYNIDGYTGMHKRELALVSTANRLSIQAGFGNAGDWSKPSVDPHAMRILGLSSSAVEAVVARARRHRDETREFLEILDIT